MTKLNTITQPTWALKVNVDANGDKYYNDMYLDNDNNIVVINSVDSVGQTLANELSLWLGEYEYNTTIGLPYDNLLGQVFNKVVFYNYIKNAANTVKYVTGINDIIFTRDREKRITRITVDYDTVDTKGIVQSVTI